MSQYVIFCDCSNPGVITTEVKEEHLSQLNRSEHGSITVINLCDWAIGKGRDRLPELPEGAGLRIYGCHPRAVCWILERGGFSITDKSVEFVDLRPALAGSSQAENLEDLKKLPHPGSWYPVIDYDRCCNCKQCLNFCLFGVYTLDSDGRVMVQQPENCKPNCPACARICPETAIIFPKYSESPINGGETVGISSGEEAVKGTIDMVSGDDPYALLAQRKRRTKMPLLDQDKVDKLKQ